MIAVISTGAPSNTEAQSIVRGEIRGFVSEVDGLPLDGVQITLTEVGGGVEIFSETDDTGSFREEFLRPGEYQVRVETRGFVPRLVRGVEIRPGQIVRLPVELVPAPPPVDQIDTVFAQESLRPRFDGLMSRWIGREEIRATRDPFMDIEGLTRLSPAFDGALGTEGLPGSTTSLVLDGVPLTPVGHPGNAGSGFTVFLPRFALESADLHARPDVEWSGTLGRTASLVSRTAAAEPGVELYASGSAGPLWKSEVIDDVPSASSFWAGGAGHLPLADNRGQLFVGVDALRVQTPRPSVLSDEVAQVVGQEGGLDSQSLRSPWSETSTAFSGLARLDWRTENLSEIMVRAGFGVVSSEGTELFATPFRYGRSSPIDASDLFVSGFVRSILNSTWSLEVKGGIEWSDRSWEGTAGSGAPSLVTGSDILSANATIGTHPGLNASATRTGIFLSGAVHGRWPNQQLKVGLVGSLPFYSYEYAFGSGGYFALSTATSPSVGDGIFLQTRGMARPSDFSVPEIGGFIQHRWEPDPGIQLITGVRVDYELLPHDDVPLNGEWFVQTGILNNEFGPGLVKFSPRVGLTWDLSGNGNTLLEAAVSMIQDQFDPAAVAEVIARSGTLRDHVQIGGLSAWPSTPNQTGESFDTGTGLTVFGPDLTSPRSTRGSVGLSQQLGASARLYVTGTFRQTEYLLRRSQLNLTVAPSGSLEDGRPVFGTLDQVGRLIVSAPGTSHRFGGFGNVWALNSDGWSEHFGLAAALEIAASDQLDLFVTYSRSSTEDNLVGARSAFPAAEMYPRLDLTDDSWAEGTSDFDVPHRIAAGGTLRLPVLEGFDVTGVYRYQSGWPFTPGFEPGVDVNGDGSGWNDPAFVPANISGLENADCLSEFVSEIVQRNACRGPESHLVDLHVNAGIAQLGSRVLSLTIDAYNLLDAEYGIPDTALLLMDPDGSIQQDGDVSSLPVFVNDNFSEVIQPIRPGRMLAIGLRLGLP